MSDTDLLRNAAARVRETANAATEGPWRAHDTHLDMGGHTASILTDREKLTDTGLIGWLPTFSHRPWNEKTNAWANATHVALWHPGVAKEIAAMLSCAADLDPSDRETVALDRCGMCGTAHLTDIALALTSEGAP